MPYDSIDKRRDWRQRNRDKIREYHRQYRENNRERVNANQREWAANNPERIAEHRRKAGRSRGTPGALRCRICRTVHETETTVTWLETPTGRLPYCTETCADAARWAAGASRD